jgi:hypothetical protein
MSGEAALDDMILKLTKLGNVEDVAKTAAPLVEAANRQTAAAGTSPDGVAWAPRKKDGTAALQNAAAAVEAVSVGPKVRLRLVGTSTGNQRVQAIQNHARPILPSTGRLGKPITSAITEAATQYFNRSMGR